MYSITLFVLPLNRHFVVLIDLQLWLPKSNEYIIVCKWVFVPDLDKSTQDFQETQKHIAPGHECHQGRDIKNYGLHFKSQSQVILNPY